MKTLAIMMLCALAFSSYSMRCGVHLVNEGDSLVRMLQLCGTPASNTLSNVIYLNKDGDGMNYYIHVDGNGIIDDIQFSRN